MNALACPSCGTSGNGSRYCGACGLDLLAPSANVATVADPAPPSTLSAGALVGGRYLVHGVLAIGSMGVIYAAADTRDHGALRALKELLPTWASSDEQAEAVAWFWREATIQAGLQHPAIPQVHDTFSEGVRHYLVMDLVEGRSLEEVLAAEGTPGLPEARVVPWAEQVLDVLSYLHSRADPLIFRDLKPANLMLTPQGQVRLIDFGIARVFTRQAQGTAIGTPGYAPPEQYQGLAEPASDLYALGATLHHLLTGRDPRTHRPFDFPPVRSLAPMVSAHTARAVDRALVLDPRHRFDCAADLYRALHPTTALHELPRLTGAAAPVVATQPASFLPGDAVVVVAIGPLIGPPRNDTVALPASGQITLGGVTLTETPEHAALELHNHSGERLPCAIISHLSHLQPRPTIAWLEPHGMVVVALDAPSGPPADPLASPPTALVARDVPIHLQVRGASLPPRSTLSALPKPAPVAALAVCSACSVTVTIAFHLGVPLFYGLNALSLVLALVLQWRSRRTS